MFALVFLVDLPLDEMDEMLNISMVSWGYQMDVLRTADGGFTSWLITSQVQGGAPVR